MENENICKFVSLPKNAPTEIHTINFVLESTDIAYAEAVRSVYAMHLITRGGGEFLCNGKRFGISKGDVFFTLPSDRYAIRGDGDLEYAYISFLGVGASSLVKRVMPRGETEIFVGNERFITFWKQAIVHAHPDNVDLISKSVLEYSAALLIASLPEEGRADIAADIENYVRRNFDSSELSLRSVAARFGYNEKYLSKLFHRLTGTYFGSYLSNLRINAACGLIQEGKCSVKEIAYACGYSDPLYFSRVFKEKMGVAPSEFRKENK